MLSASFLGVMDAKTPTQNKPLVIVLLGPPGAGKGTHAGPLAKELGIPSISTGDLFRENIRGKTPIGLQAKGLMDQGKLVPDDLVLEMLFARVALPDCKGGYILDGCPRTLAQAQVLDTRLEKTHRFLVLNFQIPDELLVERITGRIACKQCGRPYHKKYDPPKIEKICDSCGGELHQRDDDTEAVLRKRLEVYRTQTEPLIEYYAKKKDVLKVIGAGKSKDQVFQDVLENFHVPATAHR
jgi:adenylate kinase